MPIGTRLNISSYWQDWVNLALGAWLFVAPWALGYASQPAPAWNSWIFGIVVAAISIAALVQFAQWEEWINAVIAVWLVISPWVLGFAAPAAAGPVTFNTAAGPVAWNHVIVGVVVGALALWDGLSHREPPRVTI